MSIFACSSCGAEFKKWAGKCQVCGDFGTIEEKIIVEEKSSNVGLKTSGAEKPSRKALTFSEIGVNPVTRTKTGISELDRVLGGGIVDAEVILFAGSPGSGKSTLSLSLANKYAEQGKKVLYSSGEESEQQIALRAERIKATHENIVVTNETSLEVLLGHIQDNNPDLLIVDSLQTFASGSIPGAIGSVSQSKEAANVLTRLAKQRNISMVLINQLIKSGDLAGSESILHVVDCGLMLENDTESPLKFLRPLKNRFGALEEIGCFVHSEQGLVEVSDPGSIFLDTGEGSEVQGAACGFISEGIRQFPVEVQALGVKSSLSNPRKQFSGVNFQRGQIVCAILDKYCSARTFDNDVFLSTVAGAKVDDPLADLSVAAALLSSLRKKKVSKKVVFVGELSLTGSVRGTHMMESKVREAERLGFATIVVPLSAEKQLKGQYDIEVEGISKISDLADYLK